MPATGMPAAFIARIAFAIGVPPISVDSRSWLPPVKKTALACCSAASRPGSSASRRVSKSIAVARPAPSSVNSRS